MICSSLKFRLLSLHRGNKLAMLLRESLGHTNCHITVIAQVADSLANLQETLSTIQLASRIRKTQRRTKVQSCPVIPFLLECLCCLCMCSAMWLFYARIGLYLDCLDLELTSHFILIKQQSSSCSPCGRSLPKEKRGPQPLSLRAFHSTDEVDADICPLRLRGELDEHSSSDQSCDTVIQIDSDGLVQSKVAQRLAQPKFVPIIPSLHPNKGDLDDPEFTALLQELLRIPQLQGDKKTEEGVQGNIEMLKADTKPPERDCLKCETFAELQERLGCIDGSEMIMDALKSSSKGPSVNNATTKSQPQKDRGKQKDSKASESPQTLVTQGIACSKPCAGEKQTDGAFPGDSFQREDSGLYDCEECSANSSSEEPPNQTLSLNMNCRPDLPNTRTLKSGDKLFSQGLHVHAQGTTVTTSPELQPRGKQESSEAADWFKQDKRTSPVGKSSPISPSSTCSSAHSAATSVIHSDVLPHRPTEDVKEMKATITVTVQQPLDLKGQDELVFSMVEEVTINGALNRGRTGGNIICIRDTVQSHVQDSTCSQPIRIISNVIEESAAVSFSDTAKSSVVQQVTPEASTEKLQCQFRREKRFLPSFINPTLVNTDVACASDSGKDKGRPHDTTEVHSGSELNTNNIRRPEDRKRTGAVEAYVKKSTKACDSQFSQMSYDPREESSFCDETAENKTRGKRPRNTGRSHHRGREHVYSTTIQQGSEEGDSFCKYVDSSPRGDCYQETTSFSFTGSLPRSWQNANHQESFHGGHMASDHRDPRGVTSSTPCSPRVTLQRRQGRQHSSASHTPHVSSPRKYGTDHNKDVSAPRKGVGSLFETSSLIKKHDNMSRRWKSPTEDTGMLFNAKLEQLASRTNSLGRIPRDFPSLDRGGSNTSMSSKGSSKGSTEGRGKRGYKGNHEGNGSLPRVSRSPRKNPRSDQTHHFFPPESPVTQSSKHTHSKLSAVGKLKMASPKVRRLSAPSVKNLSHKGLHQSINRSASLSPDGKSVSFERTSSFFSSSPPPSLHSISRTPSQSSTCSSTKSVMQGFLNCRISDLLKEGASSPTSGGVDHTTSLPSPYSQVTAPRVPDHMSGHASDTTSVLSGDLPPAMGKTSLYFSNRNSVVSSGYDSMLRDSEATGSSTSNRGSVSDRSSSHLSVSRSSRSSRRKGGTGKTPAITGHFWTSHDQRLF